MPIRPQTSLILTRAIGYSNRNQGCSLLKWRRAYSAPSGGADGYKGHFSLKDIAGKAEQYREDCLQRNCAKYAPLAPEIAALLVSIKPAQQEEVELNTEINKVERLIKSSLSKGSTITPEQRDELTIQARDLKAKLQPLTASIKAKVAHINDLAYQLPNLSSPSSPIGTEGLVVDQIHASLHSQKSYASGKAPLHTTIGQTLSILDFTSAPKTAGWGFYTLLNDGSLLEEALLRFATDTALAHAFKRITPHSAIYSHLIPACGFQPRDPTATQQVYALARPDKQVDEGTSELSLAGTAEIPLAARHALDTLGPAQTPIKYIGASRCFRAEAGARGAATKGLYRVHEFTKAEMFAWTAPGEEEHERVFQELVSVQREIFTKLELECRVLEMPKGDLGHAAYRKWDIEAWFPSRGWGEVTSASMCRDYQARRLGVRWKQRAESSWAWSVNGTAMAVPRVMAALLECGWDAEREVVKLPEALWDYMGGLKEIGKRD
ncbi:MAG: Serine--tRNA ligase, mitochondrial [Vezdaea aestivalis]|nr:MAG: Serine--tRNA ligase, mitochondrial [Vezdaea aestivalis]